MPVIAPLGLAQPLPCIPGMPGQGLPNTPRRRVQPKPGPAFGRSLVQQVGGLLMLLLVVVPGYVMSRPIPDEVAQAAKANQSGRAVTTAMIGEHIREIAPRYGVSEVLVASIIAVESEYNPRAVSRKGARGLMQLMPATASSLRVDDPFDPRENIEAGVRHLRRLMDLFDNNLPLVIAPTTQAKMPCAGTGESRPTGRRASMSRGCCARCGALSLTASPRIRSRLA